MYKRATSGLGDRNVAWELTAFDRATALDMIESDGNFHILNHGHIRHPRALNAGIAYVYPFWNLDPNGIRAFSSLGDYVFDPATIDGAVARPFFNRLRKRLVERRSSRYEQPQEHEDLPKAAAAVFFQSEGHRTVGETLYLDRWTMLETVLETCAGRVVIVKPHPRELDTLVFDRLLDMQRRFSHLHISLGNIHDIIAASDCIVTINSAVGIESYLHRKKLILCGQSDFSHIATTAKNPQELSEALRGPDRHRAYEKFIYWYFGLMCLNAADDAVADQILTRIRATGFSI